MESLAYLKATSPRELFRASYQLYEAARPAVSVTPASFMPWQPWQPKEEPWCTSSASTPSFSPRKCSADSAGQIPRASRSRSTSRESSQGNTWQTSSHKRKHRPPVVSLAALEASRAFTGAFRDNMLAFLHDWAEKERHSAKGLPAWSVLIGADSDQHLPMLVVEQSSDATSAASPGSATPCKECPLLGWHHPVSRRDYHIIVPAVADVSGGASGTTKLGKGRKQCATCQEIIPASVRLCACCGAEVVRSDLLDCDSHLLHGVIHANGFGHLLHINGGERLSRDGRMGAVMSLWDELCCLLRVRQVSANDSAKKEPTWARLLHSIAYGHTWLARWRYEALPTSQLGPDPGKVAKAAQLLHNLSLIAVMETSEEMAALVRALLAKYQPASRQPFHTLGSLLQFLVHHYDTMPHQLTPPSGPLVRTTTGDRSATGGGGKSCSVTGGRVNPCGPLPDGAMLEALPVDFPAGRWSPKRLKLTQQVLVDVLRARTGQWVPRHDLREIARQRIGDTGLLDYTLKWLGNRHVCGHVVRRAVNAVTRVLEFTLLEDVWEEDRNEQRRNEVRRDMHAIFTVILLNSAPATAAIAAAGTAPGGMMTGLASQEGPLRSLAPFICHAAQTILGATQHLKEYPGETERLALSGAGAGSSSLICTGQDDSVLHVLCNVKGSPALPAELVTLPLHATVRDLKQAASVAFQSTYACMHSLQVNQIMGLEADDDDPLFGSIECGASVVVTEASPAPAALAAGSECWAGLTETCSWVVYCPCGATEDDGERMIACDVCNTWQHTRCAGLPHDLVPRLFVCALCQSLGLDMPFSASVEM
eukprot:jgi/Mesen1/2518/ME000016S01864